jgi:hypothetical protein
MPPQAVTVALPMLTDADRARLRRLLACSNDEELSERLAKCARAALTEHVEMFLGRKVFTRGSDFREYRLRLLLEELSEQLDLLEEGRVTSLFQTTATQSRTLIRSVLAKYQLDLEASLLVASRLVLDAAEEVQDQSFREFRASRNVVEELRKRLQRLAREDQQEYGLISQAEKSTWTYQIGEEAWRRLIRDLPSE